MASREDELRHADREAQQLIARKDSSGLLRLLENDATNYGPNAPAAVGRDAFPKSFEEAFQIPGFSASYPTPSRVVIASSGDLGYTVGHEEISVSDPEGESTTVQSRYLAIWRRQEDGSWKIVENMWNFSEPFPPQP